MPPYLLSHPEPGARLGYVQDLLLFNNKKQYQAVDEFAFRRIKARVLSLSQDPETLIGRYGRIVANGEGGKVWVLVKRYQEDLVSLLGGMAAIITALFPTNCIGCPTDLSARIHMIGAVILFATVVYFCLIAFPRSVNDKLEKYPALKEDRELMETIRAIREGKAPGNPLQKLLHGLFPDACIFCKYALAAYRNYEEQQRLDIAQGKPPKDKRTRTMELWSLYGKKITRGWVYLGCGIVIAVVLLAFLVTVWTAARPDRKLDV